MDIDADTRPAQRRYFNIQSKKRKRDTKSTPDLKEERTAKIVKVIIAILTNNNNNQDQYKQLYVASVPAQVFHARSEAKVNIITSALFTILIEET